MEDLDGLFTQEAVYRLRDEYLPRIRASLDTLAAADLWWRPHPASTSVGVLLRHLRGNVRQWILAGLDGREDLRRRAEEFSAEGAGSGPELFAALEAVTLEACAVLASLDADRLRKEYSIQGFRVSGLKAAFHVVEHFSWHAGQITWIAKLRAGAGHGLAFYDDGRLNDGEKPPA